MKRFTEENIRNEKNGSGIYKIFDRNKNLVYIGRSCNGNIKHHLTQHFGSPDYSGAKFGKRSDNFFKIDLLRGRRKIREKEDRLIRKHKPRGNKYQRRGRERR